jgi:hypothetical protein
MHRNFYNYLYLFVNFAFYLFLFNKCYTFILVMIVFLMRDFHQSKNQQNDCFVDWDMIVGEH